MKAKASCITREEMNIVRECFLCELSMPEIMEASHLDYYEVIYCLATLFPDIDLSDLISCYSIEDDKIIVMADPHVGSKFENPDYQKEVTKFAVENGIHLVVRLGDNIQSTHQNVLSQYKDEIVQVEHFVQDYPYHESVKYIDVFGNHDYTTFVNMPECMDIYSSRTDFQYLGMAKVFINWKGYRLSLLHPIKQYKMSISDYPVCLGLRGHGHKPRFKKNQILWVPALCDDVEQYRHEGVKPGFFVASIQEMDSLDYMNYDLYSFGSSLECQKNYTEKILSETQKVKTF